MSEHDKRGLYRMLESSPNTTPADIKRNYRRLALRHHPDREQDPTRRRTQHDRMRSLNEAYEILGDPDRRSNYNAECGFPRCRRHPSSFIDARCSRCSVPICPDCGCASRAIVLCGACDERDERMRRVADPVERALLALEDGELEVANRELRQALLTNPRDVVALTALSTVREKQGDIHGAVAALTLALRLKPGHAFSHYRLGILYQRMGDDGRARNSYEEARRLNPTSAKYCRAIADIDSSTSEPAVPPFRLNDRVAHQVFGSGIVTEVNAVGIRVTFGDGDIRWLDPCRAPMVRQAP